MAAKTTAKKATGKKVGHDVKFLGKACASNCGRHAIKVTGPASE